MLIPLMLGCGWRDGSPALVTLTGHLQDMDCLEVKRRKEG